MKIKEASKVLWKAMFGKIQEMDPDGLRAWREGNPEGSYTLLDVRQPKEYRQEHLPGAKLIPLPELTSRLGEIDAEKPVVAYCAIGGRSRAAAELLSGRGFSEVYSLSGGIKAWQGQKAKGPESSGMSILQPQASPEDMLKAAYGLEKGLRDLYGKLAGIVPEPGPAALLEKLAGIEEKHMQRVLGLWEELGLGPEPEEPAQSAGLGMVEGGFQADDLIESYGGALDAEQVLDLAMMIETQGMDLYMRMAEAEEQGPGQKALLALAEDEKGHLRALAEMLESLS